jgi:LacI family transcriptional regulator
VPDDVSVVGYHDVFFAEHLTPALTVVRLALEEMGRASVQALLGQLEGVAAPRHVIVGEPPPQLIVRGSTAPPPS